MVAARSVVLALLLAWPAAARAQSAHKEPHIGYLYPAGGRQGTTFRIIAGGQNLKSAESVYVTGTGVRATVLRHFKAAKKLDKEERAELWRRLDARMVALGATPSPTKPSFMRAAAKGPARRSGSGEAGAPVILPEHPLTDSVDSLGLREIEHVRALFLAPTVGSRRQPNAQIGESVVIEVSIDNAAPAGDRELRVRTSAGFSNPMCFQVGTLPEVRELEPNDPDLRKAMDFAQPDEVLEPPVLLDGQIMPGDVDRFRIRARKGQRLRVEVSARRLVPYLADAVPGWFQATVGLLDSAGKEVAFADDGHLDPDPVLSLAIAKDGEYELEIRDAIFRGREDFVYRIAVAEEAPAPGSPAPGAAADTAWFGAGLPESKESEPNDTVKTAQRVALPRVIAGGIARAGDTDLYRFTGRAGETVVAEVLARRTYSPLDSLVRLLDGKGRVLQWNDDHEQRDGQVRKEMGLLTHAADSYLSATLPRDGTYHVQVSDAQAHGGPEYAYRVRLGPPRPDFALRVTPASINVARGRAVPITIHALRRDGFAGDIEVVLKDAPAGFALAGARLERGRSRIRATLVAPGTQSPEPVLLRLEGRATIAGQVQTRPALPAEDLMQAFLYRHLAPAQELAVALLEPKARMPRVSAPAEPVRIPAGGTVQVRLATPDAALLQSYKLALDQAPAGLTLEAMTALPDGVALTLKADHEAAQTGLADNLIVEVVREKPGKDKKGRSKVNAIFVGVLPPIPFEIVRP